MKLSRQARLNRLQERLHNAHVIRELLSGFRADFQADRCKEQLQSEGKPDTDVSFADAFAELRRIKEAFSEYRPMDKQDSDALWSEYLDLSNTMYELSKRYRELTDEEVQKTTEKITALLDRLEQDYAGPEPKKGREYREDCEVIVSAFREAGGILRFKQQEALWERYRDIRARADRLRKEQRRKREEQRALYRDYLTRRIQVQEEYLASVTADLEAWYAKRGSRDTGPDAPKWVTRKSEKQQQVTEELKSLRQRLGKLER
ncbi:MAG: hypothetical protein IK083_07725 [Abditibacteriota bacterium]|nr:hypothetical protein [Abditibacteriota bacterium]